LAQTLVSQGKLDEAETLIRRALGLFQQRLGPDHPRFGGALKTLASIEALRGQDREAEDHYRQALAIDVKAIGEQSPAVAGDLLNLVPFLKRAGKFQDAKAAIERALAINTAQFGSDSPTTTGAMQASANLAYEAGQYADARQLMDRIRQIQERSFGPEHYYLAGSWAFALAPGHPSNIDILLGKADVAWAQNGPAGAEPPIRDALAIADGVYELDYSVRRNLINRLGGALWAQGKFDDAERLHRDDLAHLEQKRGPAHPSTAIALQRLADVLASSGRQGEAIVLYQRSLAINEQSRSEINIARTAWDARGFFLSAGYSLQQLAQLAFEQGVPAESVVFAEQYLKTVEQAFGSDSPVLVPAFATLARFYLVVGREIDAGKILLRIEALVGK
ncbi:unnamed protein product, partial [Phaeothamnion confervicola]